MKILYFNLNKLSKHAITGTLALAVEDIEVLGSCPVRSVLPHGEKVPL